MANDAIGTIKIVIDKGDLEKLEKQLQSLGMKTSTIMGGKKGEEKAMVTGVGDYGAAEAAAASLSNKTPYSLGKKGGEDAEGSKGFWGKAADSFDKEGKMGKLNKNLFMMQMASLGVAFSFQSIINSAMSLFQGLEDLGMMISLSAIGGAFETLATGEKGTNIMESMGVTPEMATAAWAGFTAIVSQITSVFNALAIKVLSPEMVAAILAVIEVFATELAKPQTVIAIQDIIYAVLDLTLKLIPLIPLIAYFVTLLSDSGLLGIMLLIVGVAIVLLPVLAYLGFIMQFLGPVCMFLAAALEWIAPVVIALGGGILPVILIIMALIVVIDFFFNVFMNLANGMDAGSAITAALGQTFKDIWNFFADLINSASRFLGQGNVVGRMEYDRGPGSTQGTNITTITNNYNKNVGVREAAALAAEQAKQAQGQMG